MKRDRPVASGSTIDDGGAMLIAHSRVQETGSGTGRTTFRHPVTAQACTFEVKFNFSLVTPKRIEGYTEGQVGQWRWDSCRYLNEEVKRSVPFVWVPQ